MFNLIIVAIIFLLGLVGYNFKIEEVYYVGVGLMCFSLLYLIISTISNLVYYTQQLGRFENLRKELKLINIYKERESVLLVEFKQILKDQYPELERQIFDFISKSGASVLLNFPEIKSSEVLSKLANEINSLSLGVYKQKEYAEDTCEEIRFYKISKWEIIKPEIPADLQNVVYGSHCI